MAELRRPCGDRQLELTDAALHNNATNGRAALSSRRLAAHVGLSAGAIFKPFACRGRRLGAVVTRAATVLESTYPPTTRPPAARLERFLAARSTAVGNQLGILR